MDIKKQMKIFFVIIILILTSCATNSNYAPPKSDLEKARDLLIGQHYSIVIQKMGAYTRKEEDGLGGQILIWTTNTPEKTTTAYNPFHGDDFSKMFYEKQTSAYTEEIQLLCNPEGIIYNVFYTKR